MSTSTKQLVKGAIVLAMILFLLIPALLIQGLVKERKERKRDIINEVAKNWSKEQTVSAPYIYLPTNKVKENLQKEEYFLNANTNNIDANISTQNFTRTIFTIPTYTSLQKMDGSFLAKDYASLIATAAEGQVDKALFAISLSDPKGIVDSSTIEANGKIYLLNSQTLPNSNQRILTIPLLSIDWDKATDLKYTINIKLRGTESLQFIPNATNNKITLKANCKDPSFTGSFMTENKTITDTSFEATWQISSNQTSIASITNQKPFDDDTKFGVVITNGVDGYVKTERTTKYAILFIALTFALFYFIELIKGNSLHPLQYMLIGIALLIFYTLLLSISEILGFNAAYIIASLATILLITLYAIQAMHSKKFGVAIFGVLTVLYGYIFWILHLEDTALLMGSIGLFIIVAIAMHFSKRLNNENNI
jgi:inner membrane protein